MGFLGQALLFGGGFGFGCLSNADFFCTDTLRLREGCREEGGLEASEGRWIRAWYLREAPNNAVGTDREGSILGMLSIYGNN